ncbi:MAG: YeeE/YedE family protein [Proteobacteria bacterium]|nr:YeeE/YedE family protein [Pseudomonadota bacterium]MBU1714990.1 YeeE/YedE family protein [Pseudomonadota bacterium]
MVTQSILIMYVVGALLGLISGFVMHRSDYCMAGMFRDLFMFRKTFRLRALGLQIVLTMIAFEVFRLLGLLPLYPFPILGTPSLANIMGGFLFGIGMVLAGGCVVGTLYKMGAGSLLSACAFVGLLLGSGIYAEIHPWWKAVIKQTTFFADYLTLSQLTGLSPVFFVLVVTVVTLPIFLKWRGQHQWEIKSRVAGYLQPWKTGVVLAGVGLFSYLLIGMPLGITTVYAKMAAMLENVFSPGHVAGLAFFQGKPLDVIHPASGTLLVGGAGPLVDYLWVIQFPLVVGIVLGSTLSALLLGEFKIYWRLPARQFLITLVGGTLLGLASRMVPGCNVWHLMGGLPIFALQSILFLFGLLPGVWVGSRLLSRLLLVKSST